MKYPLFSAVAKHTFGRVTVLAFPLLLAACVPQNPQPHKTTIKNTVAEPEIKIIDYLSVSCTRVWQFEDAESMKNPLYWMRAVDCAARLSPAEARAEARSWNDNNWQSVLKQSMLLSNGNVTPFERHRYVERLDNFSYDFPSSIRPLLQLWRDNQTAQLQLSAERTRYAQLQQSSDEQLDALRHRQHQLNGQLAETRRKLETLTDIERQLSARKSPDISDNNHGPVKEDIPAAVEADETYAPPASNESDNGKEGGNP